MKALLGLLGGGSFWWLAGTGLVLLATIGVQQLRIGDVKTDLAREQRDRKDERARRAEAALAAVDKARAEEHRRVTAAQEVTRDAEKALSLARADAVGARDAAGRLRRYADQLAARCDRRSEDPGAAAGGPPAEAPGAVFADMLGRLEERGRELAAYADEARIAGLACEAAYLSLTPGPAVQGAE